jgi:hypothetical protein
VSIEKGEAYKKNEDDVKTTKEEYDSDIQKDFGTVFTESRLQ